MLNVNCAVLAIDAAHSLTYQSGVDIFQQAGAFILETVVLLLLLKPDCSSVKHRVFSTLIKLKGSYIYKFVGYSTHC